MKANIWKYYLFSFLVSLTFFSGVMIPFFTKWGGLSQFQIQVLQAWFMMWIFILEIPTGAVADYVGRKQSIIVGAFLFALGCLVYISTPNFYIFLLGEFILAAAVAFQSGADEALLYDSLKSLGKESDAKKIMGRTRSLELVALGVSAPIGSFAAGWFGLQFPMFISAVAAAAAGIIGLSFVEPKDQNKKSESRRYLDIIMTGLTQIKENRNLRIIALDGIVIATSAYFVIWTYQRLLQNLQIDVYWFGFFHLILVLSQVAVNNSYSIIEKLTGSVEKYLRVTAVLVGVGFVLAGINVNIVTVFVLLLFSGGFGLTRMTYVSAHVNKLIDSASRATVLSSLSMFRRFGLIFLNPLVGYFIDKSLFGTLVLLGLIPLTMSVVSPIKNIMFHKDK